MSIKTKWVTIDVDKLDQIFTVLDKVNLSQVRGLLSTVEKDALVAAIKTEITEVIVKREPEPEPPKEEPKEEPKEPAEKSRTKSK